MSDSRRSKSRSRSKRSRHSRHGDANDSDDSSNGLYHSYHREERRRHYSRSPDNDPKHSILCHSSERTRANMDNSHIKGLVKVPIPSLLSPPSLLSSGSRGFIKEVQVVQNKSGVNRKGQFAKSLMDLHFEDQTHRTPDYHARDRRRKSDRKSSLLTEQFEEQPIHFYAEVQEEDDTTWLTPKESKNTLKKRSWRESVVGSAPSQSLFNSSYKPLVIESEPMKKVQKLDKLSGKSQPKPLLESEILPSRTLHITQTSSNRKAPLARLLDRDSSGDSLSQRVRTSDGDRTAVQNLDKIVSFESACEQNVVYVVIPSSLPWVHLHGRATIEVVKGVVYILAHALVPGTSYEVFSPSSSCLLSLQVDPGDDCMSQRDVETELKTFVKDKSEYGELSEKSIGIIKMTKLDSVICDLVSKLPPFTRFVAPRPPLNDWNEHKHVGISLFNNGIKVAPESEMCDPCMAWDDLYNDALDKWLETIDTKGIGDESPVLVTCGAKDSGKSTFNRCAVNTTLRSVSELAYIDCDVGQTEFSPPATVSLHIIRKVVLSPPFCHQRHAERMVFYGDVSPAHDPSVYIQCLHYVVQAYKELAVGKKLPLIVNTMGFPEGIGYLLFIDTLNIMRPDLVIQFGSQQPHVNFPSVTQEMVALDEGWTYNKSPPSDFEERLAQVKEHFLFRLPSLNFSDKTTKPNPVGKPPVVKLHPADFRNVAMFSALAIGLSKKETLMSLTPHTVPYHNLAIHVCRYNLAPEEMLVAIDAGIVALCETDLKKAKRHSEDLPLTLDTMPICECVGLGIVRAVDTDKGLLYISTTLPRHLLKRVNTILKGVLSLPDHFMMNQKYIRPQVPYIDVLAQATATHGLRPRSRMPRIQTKTKKFFGL